MIENDMDIFVVKDLFLLHHSVCLSSVEKVGYVFTVNKDQVFFILKNFYSYFGVLLDILQG